MVRAVQLAALIVLISQAAPPTTRQELNSFKFQRIIVPSSGSSSRFCAVLDAPVFAHATATLSDLRIYATSKPSQPATAAPQGERPIAGSLPMAEPVEIPYAITVSESSAEPPEPARVLNLVQDKGHIVFDLQMPSRSYTELLLDLQASDFLATAGVVGLRTLDDKLGTPLGTYTLFDLTTRHLSRDTSIPLQESSFPYLHLDLAIRSTVSSPPEHFGPSVVQGAQVPPTREAQTIYTTAAESSLFHQRDGSTVVDFEIPARVPVERVTFTLNPGTKLNFNRSVRISATPHGRSTSPVETVPGEITNVQLNEAGHEIQRRQLSIPAVLGANLQAPAHVEVAVQNGDNKPLPLSSVRLEMRQHKLCFDAPRGLISLFYGDSTLTTPAYEYARLFNPDEPARSATLASEQPNPRYTPQQPARGSLIQLRPKLLWISLLAVAILGLLALRSHKRRF